MHVSRPHRHALSKKRVACISLFMFACIYVSKSQTRISINGYFVDSPPDVYVILAADMNYHYLLNTPFVVQHWANLGVKSAVLLAGNEEEYRKDMASKMTVEMLRELKAEIVFLGNSNMTSGQLAQVSRNFAAGLPFTKKLRENTIFITSDVDLFIFNKEAVLPDENETIHFYNNHTTRLKFRDLTFTMFNMGTIAANLSVWRDIMDIKNSDIVNGEYIQKSIQKEYGDEFAIKNKNKMFNWYLDQHFFSLKFHKYLEKNAGRIHYKFYGRPRRLDRGNWKYSPDFLIRLNTLEHDDAHLDPAIYNKANWNRIWPLYKRIFGSGQIVALNEFRNEVIEHVNEENVKDVHP